MSHSQRERKHNKRKGEANEKSTCDTSSRRMGREREREGKREKV